MLNLFPDGVLWVQKFKVPSVQNSKLPKVLLYIPGAGQNVALLASLTAIKSAFLIFAFFASKELLQG